MMTGLVQLFLVSIALIQWFTRLDFWVYNKRPYTKGKRSLSKPLVESSFSGSIVHRLPQ